MDIIHRGTAEDIKKYCIKLEKEGYKVKEKFNNEQIIFEDGDFINECYGSGARSDLKQKIDTYKNLNEFMDNDPETYAQYRTGLKDIYERRQLKENLKNMLNRPKTKINVEYHTGAPGSGKTYYIFEEANKISEYNEHIAIIEPINGEFWQVVAGEKDNIEILLINEFRDTDMKLNKFLQILEGIGCLPIKGGYLDLSKLKRIYIASLKAPWELYKNQNEDVKGQIKRRLNKIYIHHKEGYTMDEIKWPLEEITPDGNTYEGW